MQNGTDADRAIVGELVKQWVTTPLDLETNQPGQSVPALLFPSVEDLTEQPVEPPAIVANMTFMDVSTESRPWRTTLIGRLVLLQYIGLALQ